jgi:ElaB/YqjD/DUF883 family membrane-anchored ribosome-binding protein
MSQATISPELGVSTTDRLASKGHETIDGVTPKASRAEHEIRSAATKVAESAKVMRGHAAEAAEENLRKVRSYAENNPLIAVGVAFVAGVLLTALVRR